MKIRKREDCQRTVTEFCEGCEIYPRFLEAKRDDAWEADNRAHSLESGGQDDPLPRELYENLYVWGSNTNKVWEEYCLERPDAPPKLRHRE
ncbi:hypothetical protein COT75_00005 [Candidatus Beckwithbacteria bacterium CG10_big_fil_rev_8_21_14_0_10_34_10]|uniref:Uncharacterized protein n=1 Tax=Candidatus Beckwithbacteria bacterium CG10_big_fil_rev_8_21_14_0_10_34_10 TaxID=1974495 RepID=A0A2H0WCB7_9BACT|nr:MAG: hypothetical protein COT75_00005 [Candidatus Beckwithbacteria bacterium CG10_big_fil_rev_8_21_14_0_10_34_10]